MDLEKIDSLITLLQLIKHIAIITRTRLLLSYTSVLWTSENENVLTKSEDIKEGRKNNCKGLFASQKADSNLQIDTHGEHRGGGGNNLLSLLLSETSVHVVPTITKM